MPIVAAVDQSVRAKEVVRQARELADGYGVELHVVHVESRSGSSATQEGGRFEVEVDAARERATKVATDAAERIDDPKKCQTIGLVGDPVQRITEYSREHGAEFIVVSGRKRTPVGKALFGSVTQSLLLNANRPVVSIPHD